MNIAIFPFLSIFSGMWSRHFWLSSFFIVYYVYCILLNLPVGNNFDDLGIHIILSGMRSRHLLWYALLILYNVYIVEFASSHYIYLRYRRYRYIYLFQTRLEIMPKRKEVTKRAVRLRKQLLREAGKLSVLLYIMFKFHYFLNFS